MTDTVVIIDACAETTVAKGDDGCPATDPRGVEITLHHGDGSIEGLSLGRIHAVTIADTGAAQPRGQALTTLI